MKSRLPQLPCEPRQKARTALAWPVLIYLMTSPRVYAQGSPTASSTSTASAIPDTFWLIVTAIAAVATLLLILFETVALRLIRTESRLQQSVLSQQATQAMQDIIAATQTTTQRVDTVAQDHIIRFGTAMKTLHDVKDSFMDIAADLGLIFARMGARAEVVDVIHATSARGLLSSPDAADVKCGLWHLAYVGTEADFVRICLVVKDHTDETVRAVAKKAIEIWQCGHPNANPPKIGE